jgi:uncharacterized protein with HEPN domain
MSKRSDDALLCDMREYANTAIEFMVGRTRADLDDDKMLSLAVVRALEIIGESASRVSAELRAEHPTLSWSLMISMRNRLIHAYSEVNLDIVWETIMVDLPQLVTQLDAILDDKPG